MQLRLRRPAAVLAGLALTLSSLSLAGTSPAAAEPAPPSSVTLNPAGGVQPDGSDGLRFAANRPDEAGADSLTFAGTRQYCCTRGAPMLSIGGRLFGSGAGPSQGGDRWTTVEVIETSGDAIVPTSAPPSTTPAGGDARATIRYTADVGGLEYVMTRALAYTYPNDYVTDAYAFTIPEGNTADVRFYLGGDTAPGSSDQGYGIMLTSPVRSVISLNPGSQILFGFREAPGSKPFDGARAADYYAPYGIVQTGGDIGFEVEQNLHDAGLMVQWNLGSAPGTQHASLQQFVAFQGTNLDARFDRGQVDAGQTAHLDLSVENTRLVEATGLGLVATLPAGLSLAGAVANGCGGTVTTAAGRIALSGGSVQKATNCIVRVPVRGTVGVHEMTSALVTTTGGLLNRVGTSRLRVSAPATAPVSAPSVRLTVSPATAAVGAPVTLRWTSTGVDRLRAVGAWAGTLPARGSRVVRLDEAGTARYGLVATNAAGTAHDRVAVQALARRTLAVATPTSVIEPGTRPRISARGLAPGESYTVRVAGRVVARGRADAHGRVSVHVRLPQDRGDVLRVSVTGAVNGRVGTARLKVATAKRLPLRPSQKTVRASDPITLTARLLPGEKATVRYRGVVVARGHADGAGRFRATFTVGRTWGPRTATVTGSTGSRVGRVSFTVVQRCFVTPRICR